MSTQPQQEGLIVSGSTNPLVRAGYANLIFFLLFVFSLLINEALGGLGATASLRGLVILALCLVGLRAYSHAAARIAVKNGDTLVVVGPFGETQIRAADIVEAEVWGYPLCMMTVVKIRRKTARFPSYYHFTAVATNWGAQAETQTRLRALLAQLSPTGPRT